MRIQVFAILKDFFKKEFELKVALHTIADLRTHLSLLNPNATPVLNRCRFAVQDEFVTDEYTLTGNEHVVIIPPSSGG
ncbi:MoaD/ThiS family protein [Pedobacter hiemivivus]|uniref:MoaD/ThiS family protein n=1 Tax=Pedobacter hiemivivus TaxID=2530454 RepID=A0A4R0MEX4_9SPHI|nr:MoaD/ThiS family protein [Pedobacter hiemivivus]TCC84617.1 MoaD/ThiS family protein [Pedobacter hiemivivus]TKC61436.1 MoaD/ThiS family protein [Pedobacter hiemivivus]